MKKRTSWLIGVSFAGMVLASMKVVGAQSPAQAPHPASIVAAVGESTVASVESAIPAQANQFVFFGNAPMMPFGPGMSVIGGGGSVPGQPVLGKPMSAEMTTEFVQVLQDGNRIVHTSRTRMARDGHGRTRVEHGLSAPEQIDPGLQRSMVMIDDPVAEKSYMLEPTGRVAIELPRYSFNPSAASGVMDGVSPNGLSATTDTVMLPPPAGAMNGADIVYSAVASPEVFGNAIVTGNAPEHRQEDLGEQRIEGVMAKGVRQIDIIPAGAVGNEQPIESITEIWTAESIGMPVLFRRTDPMMGEITSRTTNLSLEEPDPDLFVVPADYTIQPVPQAARGTQR